MWIGTTVAAICAESIMDLEIRVINYFVLGLRVFCFLRKNA